MNIDINMNFDISIIIYMNIENYIIYYLLSITLFPIGYSLYFNLPIDCPLIDSAILHVGSAIILDGLPSVDGLEGCET